MFDYDAESPRLRELADRLVSSGPKCCGVSASETHEISEGLVAVLDEVKRLSDQLAIYDANHGARCAAELECVMLASERAHLACAYARDVLADLTTLRRDIHPIFNTRRIRAARDQCGLATGVVYKDEP